MLQRHLPVFIGMVTKLAIDGYLLLTKTDNLFADLVW